jgi:hypothetical protein
MEARALDAETRREALTAEVIDSLVAQIAVVDAAGVVTAVNEAWRRFPAETGAPAGAAAVGQSYLLACRARGAQEGLAIAAGLEDVLAGRSQRFEHEYPCHAPDRRRWFLVHVTPLRSTGGAVIAHYDMTERKLAELARAEVLERERAARDAAAFIAEAMERLERSLEPDVVSAELARLGARVAGTLCFVDLVRDGTVVARAHAVEGESPDPAAVAGLARLAPVALPETHPVNEVAATGRSVVLDEVTGEDVERIGGSPERIAWLSALPLGSFACLPLVARGHLLGVFSVVSTRPGSFREGGPTLGLVGDLCRAAAQALDNARLYADRARTARTLQHALLPPRLPDAPGLDISARYRPATEVGGDFFDVFALGDGVWALAIGDVCGKGAEAAAVTALGRHTIRAAARYEDGPAGTLQALNDAILADRADMRFCTGAFATLRRTARGAELVCAAGGHPPPVVLRRDGVAVPTCSPGTALGIVGDPVLEETTTALLPGDAVLFYTDGLTEAAAPARALTWEDVGRLAGPPAAGAEELVSRLEAAALELAGGTQRDDVAVLGLVVGPAQASSAPTAEPPRLRPPSPPRW